ncbi:hypothetical protein EP47_09850 [Legionella norrlandica]|uniref:Ankyrin n=1 Tax=Legionella norrlandica TaxID=1498499 RepID=A0A0A2SU55_9GAMM|nr:ankyrin repeat domain-containing protein [Legionella norrlandica]KGP62924.1 hypothetical protein EP47_09850 [Legionella norrlandica]
MIINDLFNWLENNESPSPLVVANQTINQELLQKEESQTLRTHHELIAQARIAKFSGLPMAEINKKLEQHKVFKDYLIFCRQQFQENEKNTLFLIALKHLLLKTEAEQFAYMDKINELFWALLRDSKIETLNFYDNNEALFKNCHEIQRRMELECRQQKIEASVQTVKNHFQDLTESLAFQKNPLGIIALFREWVSDTEKFAALLLCLLQKEVSIEKILQTNLLQDFLKYHLHNLHSEDSEVNSLYSLLSFFPETQALVEAAQNVSCGEPAFQQYSLDGNIQNKTLAVISPSPAILQFSLNSENFFALYQLFGQSFLAAAIIYGKGIWLDLLKQTLNQPETVETLLPGLINFLARESSEETLKTLAELIDDTTAQQLLKLNQSSIFHLLQYKPLLLDVFQGKNISEYISQLLQINHSDQDIIYQLMALFLMLLKQKHPATKIVFEAIIDNLVHYPYLIEDEELLKHLKKYKDSDQLLAQRGEKIQQQLHHCIIDQTAQSTFEPYNYHIIEATWLDATRKIDALNRINPQIKVSLGDKYKLQARIAEIAFHAHGSHFDLDHFIDSLGLPPVASSEEVSAYERVLIEIIAAIDDVFVREQIINKLETSPIERLNWHQKEYGGKSIFIKAAKYGNLGLISLLGNTIDTTTLEKAISCAAKHSQWEAFDHLCSINKIKLNHKEIQDFVILAAKQGQINSIQVLMNLYSYQPSAKIIQSILTTAIEDGEIKVVDFFYSLSIQICRQPSLDHLFKLAVQFKHWNILEFLVHSEKAPPPQSTIERAFEQTAYAQQMDAVKILCNLPNHCPRPQIIGRVLLKACKLKLTPVVQYLCSLPLEPLSKLVIEKALIEAIANGHLEIVTSLCESPFIRPEKSSINIAIKMAAKSKQTEIFIALCSNRKNPPSKEALKLSSHWAIRTGNLDIIKYLCTNQPTIFNQHMLEQALLLAIKFKRPEIARYLCQNPEITSNRKITHSALNKAITARQTDIVGYLRQKQSNQPNANDKYEDNYEVSEKLIGHGLFKKRSKTNSVPETNTNYNSTPGEDVVNPFGRF